MLRASFEFAEPMCPPLAVFVPGIRHWALVSNITIHELLKVKKNGDNKLTLSRSRYGCCIKCDIGLESRREV